MVASNLNEEGLKASLEALSDVLRACARIENRAAAKMSEAESELVLGRKLLGYVKIEISEVRQRLQQLQEQK